MKTAIILSLMVIAAPVTACAKPQPSEANVAILASGQYASFEGTLKAAKRKLDEQMTRSISVPVPKDAGGGFTHEKHKENAKLIYDAGQVYLLTGDETYAKFAKDLLRAYADVYPEWGLHPAKKEQSPGRMFWQNLNESWWLLHASQSYGAIKATLSKDDREYIEDNLLRNMANFLSVGSPETFDKIHNHGTWATAAVGLTGYAIGDYGYVEQALMGLDKSGRAGFLKQMDVLFSPDGYYNEGPYYQRYALMPFVVFAQAVQENEPKRRIFEQRDGILIKAIYATIQQSYGGLFFPINDALKDKGIATTELLYGVSIAYDLTRDPGLLAIAQMQGKFVLTPESRSVSDDIAAGFAQPFDFTTLRLRDGKDGSEGALDILRSSQDPKAVAVVMKNTSQGLGHGHFDKLGFIYYDNGQEIISDYGAARFLNIEAKYGGHYLPENDSFAKQTIAHNTLVVDEQSHFQGQTKIGNQHAPRATVFVNTSDIKIASAKIDTAYEGVNMERTMVILSDAAFPNPLVVDVMSVKSNTSHRYDLPFYYQGQLIETNYEIDAETIIRKPLGGRNGYQYLWNVGSAEPRSDFSQITWLKSKKFYTLSTSLPEQTKVVFVEVGANDPNFNLRRETAAIMRSAPVQDASYVSVIEAHGEYNPIAEFTLNSHSSVESVIHEKSKDVDFVEIKTVVGQNVTLLLSNDPSEDTEHSAEFAGQLFKWTGPYKLIHSKTHNSESN